MDGVAENRGSDESSSPVGGALRTEDGSWTLHQREDGTGEACHSRSGARTEARRHAEVVLDPFTRAGAAADSWPTHLRMCDLGFGLGLNAAAVAERVAALAPAGTRLTLVGLEHDPGLVRRALALPPDPDGGFEAHLAPLRAAAARALDAPERPAVVEVARGVELELWLGDARATLGPAAARGAFHGVLLDPFSPKSDERPWAPAFLAELAAALRPGARIATYTAATRVRAALAAAGLAVGATPRLGSKAEGTVAARGGPVPPLEPRAARRVARRAAELAAEFAARREA